MMSCRALLTDGNYRNTLAVQRNLYPDILIDVLSESTSQTTLCGLSKYSNSTIKIKTTVDREAYGRQLLEILRSGNYDYFLPVGLNSCLASSMFKSDLSKEAYCLLPNWDDMQMAYNKDQTMALANKIGVPTPETIELSSFDDLDMLDKFPIVLKSSDQHSVRYCTNLEEAKNQFGKLSTTSRLKVIAQEIITGYGCGFYAVYSEGQLMDFFLHKRLREFPITGGSSAVAESYHSKRLFELGKLIGDSLNWNGPIMVEFKYDQKAGDYKLIEVNPKLWGSLDLTLAAGVDIPRLIFGIADQSITKPIASNYEEAHYADVRFRWPFPDQFQIFCTHPSVRAAREILFCDGSINFDIADPLPSLLMIWTGLLEGFQILINEERRYPHGRRPAV